jgi:hypothetical protein
MKPFLINYYGIEPRNSIAGYFPPIEKYSTTSLMKIKI